MGNPRIKKVPDWFKKDGITLFPFGIYVKDGCSKKLINHELIHWEQQKEMLCIFFYIWYGIEYLINIFIYQNAYKKLSHEQEAYDNDQNMDYLKTRKRFAWLKYLKYKPVK